MTRERPKFSAICFDCDGTLTRIEGIDELARRSGQEDAIAPLTAAAMEGSLSLEEVYAKRLAVVRPDRDALAWLGQRYVEERRRNDRHAPTSRKVRLSRERWPAPARHHSGQSSCPNSL